VTKSKMHCRLRVTVLRILFRAYFGGKKNTSFRLTSFYTTASKTFPKMS